MSQMSLESSLSSKQVTPTEFVPVAIQPTVTSVLSNAIQKLVHAIIGEGSSKLSKKCMERLAELTREHDQANKQDHIRRCFKLFAQVFSGPRSTPRSL